MATVTKLGDKYYKIVLDQSNANYINTGYIIFSAQGRGDGVVVTKKTNRLNKASYNGRNTNQNENQSLG